MDATAASIDPEAVVETFRVDDAYKSAAAPGITFRRIMVRPRDASNTRARLVLVHGYGDHCGRYVDVMAWLAARGVACYALDLRGHGGSSGRRAYVRRWDQYLDDLDGLLAQPETRENPANAAPLFVLGHSHGGLVVAVAGIRQRLAAHGVAGVILSAPYLVNAFRVPMHKSVIARVANVVYPWVRIRSGIRPDMTSSDPAMIEESRKDPLLLRCATPRWFVGHRRAQREALRDASKFTLPLFVAQGDADVIADPRGAAMFHERAGSRDKSLTTYPGFRHEPLRETFRERVYQDVLSWIARRATPSA